MTCIDNYVQFRILFNIKNQQLQIFHLQIGFYFHMRHFDVQINVYCLFN